MKDLTKGNEAKAMLQFAFPLIIGNIFQQFYNISDTILVCKYVGSDALEILQYGKSYLWIVATFYILIGYLL